MYDKKDNYYYLRSFSKDLVRGGDKKQLDPSRMDGWYIDYSTVGASAGYGSYLKVKLKGDSTKLKSKKNEDKKDWKEFNKIENRKDFH